MSILKAFPVLLTFLFWSTVQANSPDIKEAMVVSYSGIVEIFTLAESEANLSGKTFVIFDGHKFASRRVQSGAKVHPGDVLRSGNNGKMKIVYNNGDVFILGPATAFVIPAKVEKGPIAEIRSEVLYGKVRAVVDKKGPLSGFQIRTQSIVSGVRGTDLLVNFDPLTQQTQVHVLRGEVAVQTVASLEKAADASAQIFSVKTGQKAVYLSSNLKVQPSTQQDLKWIQSSTEVPPVALKDFAADDKVEVEKILKVSNEKILEDIRVTTPDVAKLMVGQKSNTFEDITHVMMQNLAQTAPNDTSTVKPKLSDFEKDEDIYKKYFKPVEK